MPLALRHVLAAVVVIGLGSGAVAAPAGPDELVARSVVGLEAALAEHHNDVAEAIARRTLRFAKLTLGAEALEVANVSRLLGDSLFNQQRFDEAEPYFRSAHAIRRKVLGLSKATAISASDLGFVLKNLGRFTESEAFFREALDMREVALGPDDPQTAKSAFWLARMVDSNGRTAEAAEIMRTAVEKSAAAFGPEDPFTVQCIGEQAAMLHNSNDLKAAEPLYRTVLELGAKAFDSNDWRLAAAQHGLANLLMATGRAEDAVPLYRQALAAREASFGPSDLDTISSVDRLARALWATDQTEEAERLFRRVLAAREAADGPDSIEVADVLRWVGRAADRRGHAAEAEIIYKRSLEISESKLGPQDALTAFDLIALGELYSGQQRFVESRPLLERGIAVLETSTGYREAAASARMALSFLELASGNRETALSLAERALQDIEATAAAHSIQVASAMAIVASYRQQNGDLAGAEALVAKALTIYSLVAPQSRDHIRTISLLGSIKLDRGELDESLTLDRDALAAVAARYGDDSPELQVPLADVAGILYRKGDYRGAADNFARSARMIDALAAIDSEISFQARTGDVEDPAIARAAVFDGLIKAYFHLGPDYVAEAFAAAQRVTESEAANALQQMAARQADGGGEIAHLVRERQDLVAAWRTTDSALSVALGSGKTDVSPLRKALAATDARILEIDQTLAKRYPDFAHLQRPAALDFATVQSRLADNETMLVFADVGRIGEEAEATYLWAIPRSGDVRWVALPRATGELVAAIRELRQNLGVGVQARGPTAVAISGQDDRTGRVLGAASRLYEALLGQVADLIAGKDLVIVPSKSLSSLPFHALVEVAPPAASTDRYRDAQWLALDHAVTILPSVASLATGRAATSEQESIPYVAFANPLLTGQGGGDLRALTRAGCAPALLVAVAETQALPEVSALFRGPHADAALVKSLPPLPDTTDEVCAIAQILGAGSDALHLGANATETALKSMSAEGTLARARIVHFATHGLVSGDLQGLAEPAIVLTPPSHTDGDNDGLLTASEVATLELDADWVILSACNTASGDGGGEALSGLARAFFYAGARALLVSHWPVNSLATVRLVSHTIEALRTNPGISRAEALRRAMVEEIGRGGPAADPSSWAPFILVGASR